MFVWTGLQRKETAHRADLLQNKKRINDPNVKLLWLVLLTFNDLYYLI